MPSQAVDLDQDFAQVLSQIPQGLFFLTTGDLKNPRGMLVSWVSQVSGAPPMVMVAVRQNRSLLPHLNQRAAFALNLLPQDDTQLLELLARPGSQRLQGVGLCSGWRDLPCLERALSVICCPVREVWRPGDHFIMAGEVKSARALKDGDCLTTIHSGHPYLGLA